MAGTSVCQLHSVGTSSSMACGFSGIVPSFIRIVHPHSKSMVGISSKRSPGGKVVCAAAAGQRVSFESSVYTDLLLREFQTVPFEQYMEDKDRIFDAIFPDTQRRQKLNDEEWRIFMLPLDFFFLRVRPVVDMRITLKEATKTSVGSTRTVFKLLSLEATKWELRGLDYVVNPSDFDLGIVGSLYPEKRALGPARLKGHMKLCIDLSIPPSLGLMPAPVIESVGKVLLSQVLENLKERVNRRLLQDYKEYAEQQPAQMSSA